MLLEIGVMSIVFTDLILKIFALAGVSLLSYRYKFLDLSGILTALLVGGSILFMGGWNFFILLLIFLVVGSLLTKISHSKDNELIYFFNNGSVRGWRNVLANGFWPMYAAILYSLFPPTYRIYAALFFIGSLTSMVSDTVSTEVGLYFGGEPFLITNPRARVPRGYSGGITLEGLLGGFLSALVFSLISTNLFNIENFKLFLIFALSGFLGSVFDSILGATIQAKYKCVKCGSIVESRFHCGYETKLLKGFESLDNHTVNFISSLFGGVCVIVFGILFL